MNINALTAYLALSSGSYSGILRDMYAVHNLGLNPDLHTKLLANRFVGGTKELSGIPPLSFKSKGKPLTAWSITGNTVQNGTPTPDNPIMPQGTGKKTAQLFDYQTGTPTAYKYLDENGTENEVSEIAPWYITDYIPIPDGVLSVTLSKIGGGSPAMCAYDASKNYITGIKYDTGSAVTKVDITLTSSTPIRFIRFSYFLGNTGYDDISTKMLNSGSTALPYEPYGYKIPVVTRGKNLLEPIGFSAEIITNINDYRKKTNNYGTSLSTVYGGSVLVTQANQIDTTTSYVNGVFYIVVDFSKFTTGKNYILSFDYEIKEKHSVQGNSIAYIGNSTSPTKIYGDWGKDGRKSVTFTVKGGFKPYIAIRLCGNSIFVSNIQIEEDSTTTPYEPYHEPITTPVYLGEVQTTRQIKKLVLTGDEQWQFFSDALGTWQFYINDISLGGVPTSSCMSNIAPYGVTASTRRQYDYGCYLVTAGNGVAFQMKGDKDTLIDNASWKSYLAAKYAAGTPVTAWYVLAKEETAVVNEPLMKIGDYADTLSMEQAGVQIPTLNGTTVIDVDTAVKPESMTIKYRR